MLQGRTQYSNSHPECPYSQQLAKGFSRLKFDRPLEDQYRHQLLDSLVTQHKLLISIFLLLWFGMTGMDLVRLNLLEAPFNLSNHAQEILTLRAACIAIMLFTLMMMFIPRLCPYRPGPITGLQLLNGLAGATIICLSKREGITQLDSAHLLIIVAAFLPWGLTWMQSLMTALTLYAGSWVIGDALLQGPQRVEYMNMVHMMPLAIFISALGGYLRDHAQRKAFLLQNVMRWQAEHDPLTNLANRRLFNEQINRCLGLGQREGIRTALILFDIDHFKRYNDHYGHPTGDKALVQVADILQQESKRTMDLCARLGGEEFALLHYDSDEASLQKLLDKIHARLKSQAIVHADNPVSPFLTLSIGAAISLPGESAAELYIRADKALYHAKEKGRNRSEIDLRSAHRPHLRLA
ncbi:GGDEF domain-containing protein [Ectopseudomonas mendocina]|uniref:diguanylate cyclase n=1 Tax=Ectopseudomonas mendocina TaxID=300 RepID=A0ABZ2REV8_ECTME